MKKDFEPLHDDVLGILLYGSLASEEDSERSDIDISIVAPAIDDNIGFSRWILSNVRDARYDVRMFELMPLYLKAEVVGKGEVIYTKNIFKLYEYFYYFRKIWEDQKRRQKMSKKEVLQLFG
ncbi:MAG: DNA polymerase subunit beta [Candidatus Methanogaster sp.]|uniref:DNA polymerase subunit beta n=1 Tax=Candidatus Methanogaster sp. TaxID=3386292 RepID=A0AC61KZC4_9EURY|nr:MAG: DNA polymerase subunit beta [ANME-2 cluster archaeon]